jgi:hypothetical protein
MAELSGIVSTEFLPHYRAVHDLMDTGTPVIVVAGAPAILFPCDGLAYNYFNHKEFYNIATSNFKDTIEHSSLDVEIKINLTGQVGSLFQVTLEVPDPLGALFISSFEYRINRPSSQQFHIKTDVYNRPESRGHIYGYTAYVSSSVGDITIENRSIKIRQ